MNSEDNVFECRKCRSFVPFVCKQKCGDLLVYKGRRAIKGVQALYCTACDEEIRYAEIDAKINELQVEEEYEDDIEEEIPEIPQLPVLSMVQDDLESFLAVLSFSRRATLSSQFSIKMSDEDLIKAYSQHRTHYLAFREALQNRMENSDFRRPFDRRSAIDESGIDEYKKVLFSSYERQDGEYNAIIHEIELRRTQKADLDAETANFIIAVNGTFAKISNEESEPSVSIDELEVEYERYMREVHLSESLANESIDMLKKSGNVTLMEVGETCRRVEKEISARESLQQLRKSLLYHARNLLDDTTELHKRANQITSDCENRWNVLRRVLKLMKPRMSGKKGGHLFLKDEEILLRQYGYPNGVSWDGIEIISDFEDFMARTQPNPSVGATSELFKDDLLAYLDSQREKSVSKHKIYCDLAYISNELHTSSEEGLNLLKRTVNLMKSDYEERKALVLGNINQFRSVAVSMKNMFDESESGEEKSAKIVEKVIPRLTNLNEKLDNIKRAINTDVKIMERFSDLRSSQMLENRTNDIDTALEEGKTMQEAIPELNDLLNKLSHAMNVLYKYNYITKAKIEEEVGEIVSIMGFKATDSTFVVMSDDDSDMSDGGGSGRDSGGDSGDSDLDVEEQREKVLKLRSMSEAYEAMGNLIKRIDLYENHAAGGLSYNTHGLLEIYSRELPLRKGILTLMQDDCNKLINGVASFVTSREAAKELYTGTKGISNIYKELTKAKEEIERGMNRFEIFMEEGDGAVLDDGDSADFLLASEKECVFWLDFRDSAVRVISIAESPISRCQRDFNFLKTRIESLKKSKRFLKFLREHPQEQSELDSEFEMAESLSLMLLNGNKPNTGKTYTWANSELFLGFKASLRQNRPEFGSEKLREHVKNAYTVISERHIDEFLYFYVDLWKARSLTFDDFGYILYLCHEFEIKGSYAIVRSAFYATSEKLRERWNAFRKVYDPNQNLIPFVEAIQQLKRYDFSVFTSSDDEDSVQKVFHAQKELLEVFGKMMKGIRFLRRKYRNRDRNNFIRTLKHQRSAQDGPRTAPKTGIVSSDILDKWNKIEKVIEETTSILYSVNTLSNDLWMWIERFYKQSPLIFAETISYVLNADDVRLPDDVSHEELILCDSDYKLEDIRTCISILSSDTSKKWHETGNSEAELSKNEFLNIARTFFEQ